MMSMQDINGNKLDCQEKQSIAYHTCIKLLQHISNLVCKAYTHNYNSFTP